MLMFRHPKTYDFLITTKGLKYVLQLSNALMYGVLLLSVIQIRSIRFCYNTNSRKGCAVTY